VAYAGFGAYYALKQHEVMYNHVVGQWKYLTTALQTKSSDVYDIIKNSVAGVINNE
jgi:hypothetical protein